MQTTVPDPQKSNAGSSVASTPTAGNARAPGSAGQRALWTIVVLALAAGGYAWYGEQRAAEALQREVAQRLTAVDASAAQLPGERKVGAVRKRAV